MLECGRGVPDVVADELHVRVTFAAGDLDEDFTSGLAVLADDGFSTDVLHSVNALLVLRTLWDREAVSLRAAGGLLQAGEAECRTILTWLTDQGLISQDDQRPEEWRLSDRVRTALTRAGAALPERGAVERWILDAVANCRAVTNREVVEATGTNAREVTRILRYLADTRRVEKEPGGPDRGTGVRWRATAP